MKEKVILSIDWDFFFPDVSWFDWVMKENNSILYEAIWPIRWASRNIKTGECANEVCKVNELLYNGFWGRVLANSNPKSLVICDSHAEMEKLFNFHHLYTNGSVIWNFDQHHDVGYGEDKDFIDCGNWAWCLREYIKEYNLVYPEWRREFPETLDDLKGPTTVYYGIPDTLPSFDIVFICRSSPWTPSWCDNKWIEFIDYFKRNYPFLWVKKLAVPFALKPRKFSLSEAKALQEQFEQLKKTYKMEVDNGVV